MKFSEFLKIEKDNLIQIDNSASYVIAGVQNYGKGVLNKRKVSGAELTMRKYQLIKENQLMWCKVDTKNGAFGVTTKEHIGSLASTNMCLANIDIKKVMPDFLQLLFTLDWFYNLITEKSSGTTNRQYLTPPQILELVEIADFSITEQKEFIRKHKLFINGGLMEELKQQQTHLQLLRQAILQEAVQGKLAQQSKDDEPADKLLQRIKAEKQKLIAAGMLKKEKQLPPVTKEEISFELPKGWVWCRLGEIINLVSGVTLGKTYKEELIKVPYLRVANVQRGYVDITHLKELVVPKSEIEKYALKKGDLVMIEGGDWDKVGRCALWNGEVKPCIHQNHIFRLRFYGSISNQWAELFLNSPVARRYFESCSKQTTNLASINKTQLTNLLFAIPPLSEQHRIVAKVQQLLQLVNELEQQVATSQALAGQLLREVLKEAFTGKSREYAENDLLTLAAEE